MLVFKLVYSPLIRGVAMKSSFSNDVSTEKGDIWNFTSYFVFFPQYYWRMFFIIWSVWSMMIQCSLWMMLILRKFSFPLMEGLVKYSIKLFGQSFKTNDILCCHEDIIGFNYKGGFIIIVNKWEYIVVRGNYDHNDCDE